MSERPEDPLATEIRAFEAMRATLEKNHSGKFIVIRGGTLVGAWDTLDAAAREAVMRFGRGPYLIRQVGEPPTIMPASVMFRNLEYI
jgi:hypothetical protein